MGVVAQSSTVREVSKRATTMEKERKTFVFHKEWYDAIAPLDEKTRCEVYEAIMHHVWELGDIPLSPLAEMAMRFIRPQIVQDTDKWLETKAKRQQSGKLGGLAKQANATKCKQEVAKGSNCKQKVANLPVYVYNNNNGVILEDNSKDDITKEEKKENSQKEKIEENDSQSKSRKRKNEYTEDFERAWKLALRKGSKEEAYKNWLKLKDSDKEKVLKHLPFYYQSNERQYLKDFSGYLNRSYYSNVVCDRQGNVLYDPERENGDVSAYTPMTSLELRWNEIQNCYIFTGMFWNDIYDGYTKENRPDGARIMLNNGRGYIHWSSEFKEWLKD